MKTWICQILFVYLGIIKVMSNIVVSRMNQEALQSIGEGDFIKFEYKHPVLEGRRALFTFVGHEAKTKGETFC